jgi:hypothetical protein
MLAGLSQLMAGTLKPIHAIFQNRQPKIPQQQETTLQGTKKLGPTIQSKTTLEALRERPTSKIKATIKLVIKPMLAIKTELATTM